MTKEIILCSCVRFKGLEVCGRRHKDCYSIIRAIDTNFKQEDALRKDQGFMTSTGRFVDRKEAWQIALFNNQILHGLAVSDNGDESELISENLYLNDDE
jgi:hypothetical protein